jgi:hypothetical protein
LKVQGRKPPEAARPYEPELKKSRRGGTVIDRYSVRLPPGIGRSIAREPDEKASNEIKVYLVIASRGRRDAPSESEAIQGQQAGTGLLRRKSSSQ